MLINKSNLAKIILLTILPSLLLLTLRPPATIHAQSTPNRAGLVVQYGDGSVVTKCIEFTEPQITGIQVLRQSGLDIVTSASPEGEAVCKIGNLGCPAESCLLCQVPYYWSYWRLIDYTTLPTVTVTPGPTSTPLWYYSGFGAGISMVKNGDVEGWHWTDYQRIPPPLKSFDDICPPAAPTSTDTPTSTNTQPPPTATNTPPSPTATTNILYEMPTSTNPVSQATLFFQPVDTPIPTVDTSSSEPFYTEPAPTNTPRPTSTTARSVPTATNVPASQPIATKTPAVALSTTPASTSANLPAEFTDMPLPTLTPVPSATPAPSKQSAAGATPTLPSPQSSPTIEEKPTQLPATQVALASSGQATTSDDNALPANSQSTPQSTSWRGYIVFGLLLLALGGGVIFAMLMSHKQ